MDAINRQSLKQRSRSYLRNSLSLILLLLVTTAAAVTVFVLIFLIFYILMKRIPYLILNLFAWEYNNEDVSLTPAFVNAIMMMVLALLIAAPLNISAAIYLVEYAKKGNKVVRVIHVTAKTLSGTPSIVYGLFDFLLFGVTLKWGYSLIGDALTLVIMILPPIMRTTEETLRSIPDSCREGSFELGVGRLRTVFKIVFPSTVSGILAGVILTIGGVVGGTAALTYTAGTVIGIPDNLIGSDHTLTVHMYMLTNEGLYTNQSYATTVMLLVIMTAINTLFGFITKQIGEGKD